MNTELAMEHALDDLEERLDSLERKVTMAIEQSMAMLEYVRTHPIHPQTRTLTRRIILEETTMLPEAVQEES